MIPFVFPITFVAIAVIFSSLSVPNVIQIRISFPWCCFVDDDDSTEHRYGDHIESVDDRTLISGTIHELGICVLTVWGLFCVQIVD